METIAIAGSGVIGGSLAKALIARGEDVRVFSPDRGERGRARADGLRVHDSIDAAFMEGVSLMVIAVPLDRIANVALTLKPLVSSSTTIIHTGSLQRPAALGLPDSAREWLIGTHPLAGSEQSGYAAADAQLFAGATISADDAANAAHRERVHALWMSVGAAKVVWRAVDDHDHLMTWISHLPQLASTALALAVSRKGMSLQEGGPGLRDATRLAASSLLMWRPILDAGAAGCIEALRMLEQCASELRDALESGDQELMSEMWTAARRWRTADESVHAR